MKELFSSFSMMWKYLKADKVGVFLSAIPVTIGVILYYLMGLWFYQKSTTFARSLIENYSLGETWGDFLYYAFLILVTLIAYFIISWTFVLIVSLIAAPFHDMLSERVERFIQGKSKEDFSESFFQTFKRWGRIFFNEAKKILFILILTSFALLLNFFPLLAPVSFFLSAIILSIEFIDYSWGRKELTFSQCKRDLGRNWPIYGLAGSGFIIFMSLPGINLIALPLGVIYFTILWVRRHERLTTGG